MVPDNRKSSGRIESPVRSKHALRPRTRDARKRFYTILLLFIVVVGLPVLGVPSLRHRLVERVNAIKGAVSGKSAPVKTDIAETPLPFPEEFERPDAPLPGSEDFFPMDRIFTAKPEDSFQEVDTLPALITPEYETADTGASKPVSGEVGVMPNVTRLPSLASICAFSNASL